MRGGEGRFRGGASGTLTLSHFPRLLPFVLSPHVHSRAQQTLVNESRPTPSLGVRGVRGGPLERAGSC